MDRQSEQKACRYRSILELTTAKTQYYCKIKIHSKASTNVQTKLKHTVKCERNLHLVMNFLPHRLAIVEHPVSIVCRVGDIEV